MPLYRFLNNLLNVLVQIANKTGLQNKILDCLLNPITVKFALHDFIHFILMRIRHLIPKDQRNPFQVYTLANLQDRSKQFLPLFSSSSTLILRQLPEMITIYETPFNGRGGY
jgi:hypothetical protein